MLSCYEEQCRVVFHVRNGLSVERRNDLESDEIEAIWIQLNQSNTKLFLVDFVYRSPSAKVGWNEHFEKQLDKVIDDQNEIYILGDFNRDLVNNQIERNWLNFTNFWSNPISGPINTRK